VKKLYTGLFILATAQTLSSVACLPTAVTSTGTDRPNQLSGNEGAEELYRGAQEAQNKADWATAKTRYQQIIDSFPASPRYADALAALGDIYFRQSGCESGAIYLEKLVDNYPEHPQHLAAKRSLNSCRSTQASTLFEDAENDQEKLKIAIDASKKAIEVSDFSGAVKWLVSALKSSSDSSENAKFRKQITEIIESKISDQEVRVLLEEFDSTEFPVDLLTFKLGRILYNLKDFANAQETLSRAIQIWPTASSVDEAKHLLQLIAARSKVNPITIGVLVPMSGRLKRYGKNVSQAVRLAAGEFESSGKGKDAPPSINIVFRDSKGNADAAAKAIEDFVLIDGAIAVIGGLFRVESESAAHKAQELGVPFLSLSSIPKITDIGPYVFRSGLTNQAQITGIVDYAMDVLGLKKFALLYPRHPYGETFIHLFWDRIIEKGGEIRGVESYGSDDTTFTWPVKRLVGRARLKIRRDYKEAVKECKKQPDPYRVQRCIRKVKSDLPPIVDFDALFIPDYPSTLVLVAPALASEDIIVEQSPRKLDKIEKTLGRKVRPITLLGTSGWNNPVLPKKAERYVENAHFPDGFFPQSNEAPTVKLVSSFRKNFQRTPMLQDALFFDAVTIVRQLVEKQKPPTRNAMREALRRVDNFNGATGKTSFRAGQDAQKSIHILKIKNSRIVEAPPPVEKAPTVGTSDGTN